MLQRRPQPPPPQVLLRLPPLRLLLAQPFHHSSQLLPPGRWPRRLILPLPPRCPSTPDRRFHLRLQSGQPRSRNRPPKAGGRTGSVTKFSYEVSLIATVTE